MKQEGVGKRDPLVTFRAPYSACVAIQNPKVSTTNIARDTHIHTSHVLGTKYIGTLQHGNALRVSRLKRYAR
jgi:hypothetical protein